MKTKVNSRGKSYKVRNNMQLETPALWFRTIAGLESLALSEIEEYINIANADIQHRSVFVTTDESPTNTTLQNIHLSDDVFYLLGKYKGIDHRKDSLDGLASYFEHTVIPFLRGNISEADAIRVTVSFLGERNFNRYFLERKLSAVIKRHTSIRILYNEQGDRWEKGEYRIRCHIEGDTAYLGFGVFDTPLHRRTWRKHRFKGQLPPQVAAAMGRLAQNIFGASRVIDPFCGSGTIVIESALMYPSITAEGIDINADAVKKARVNAEQAGVSATFSCANAFENTQQYTDVTIVSNPPWGELYNVSDPERFAKQLITIISYSRGAVLIVPPAFLSLFTSNALTIEEKTRVRIHGKIAVLVIIRHKQ